MGDLKGLDLGRQAFVGLFRFAEAPFQSRYLVFGDIQLHLEFLVASHTVDNFSGFAKITRMSRRRELFQLVLQTVVLMLQISNLFPQSLRLFFGEAQLISKVGFTLHGIIQVAQKLIDIVVGFSQWRIGSRRLYPRQCRIGKFLSWQFHSSRKQQLHLPMRSGARCPKNEMRMV